MQFAHQFVKEVMDAEMSEEAAKALLIAALNNDTLVHLNNHVSMLGEVDTTRLETTVQRLHKVSYQQILSYLKQGNLQESAN